MRYKPLNLLGGFGKDTAIAWNAEDTVNYIPEKAASEGSLTPTKLRSAPGLKPFVEIVADGPPIRGAHNAEGKYFVVVGQQVRQISNTGIAIPVGTIPGSQRVSIAHNQITNGNEVLFATGTPNGYIYNTVTQVFGKITDPGYPGTGSIDYVDSYLVQVEPGGRYWFWSDLAAAGDYNTLDRAEAEASPDRIVGLAVNNFEVVIFGQKTVEFFYNAGSATGTFQSKRIWIEHGCASRFTIAKMDNTIYWLSPERILYRLNGYQAEPVSTPQFEEAIAGFNLATSFAFVYEDQGHKIYYLTFPGGQTFGFDVTTGMMHRRESYGLDRWRLNTLTNWNGKWVGGDFQQARLYELDWAYMLEGEDQPLVSERTSGMLLSAQNAITIPYLELLVNSGQPETIPVLFPDQPTLPTISGDMPDGVVGIPHPGVTYTVGGGTPPYIVSQRPSSTIAVPGFTMNSAGVVAPAVPDAAGDFLSVPRVTDSNGLWAEISDPVRIINPTLAGHRISTGGGYAVLGGDYQGPWINDDPVFLNAVRHFLKFEGRFFSYDTDASDGVYTEDIGATWVSSSGGPFAVSGPCFGWAHEDTAIIGRGILQTMIRTVDSGDSFDEIVGSPEAAAVAYLADIDRWISISRGTIFNYSDDGGDAWTAVTAPAGFSDSLGLCRWAIADKAWFGGNTPFPEVPKVLFTADGIIYSDENLPVFATAQVATCIVEGNDILVIGTDSGEIAYKKDGTWHIAATNFGAKCFDVTFNGADFVMIGGDGSLSDDGFIKTSTDGNIWITRRSETLAFTDTMIAVIA